MQPKYIEAPAWIMRLIGASAVTVYPFVFIYPGLSAHQLEGLRKHEGVHWAEQRKWCIYGAGLGLFVWFWLYLLALPVWWNPLRRSTETRAYRAEGFSDSEIAYILKKRPYYLL